MYRIEKIAEQVWWFEGDAHSSFYVVEGSDCAAVIDTGMDPEEILPEIRKVTELPLKLIITHAHWDHILHIDEFPEYAISQAEEEFFLKGRQDKAVPVWIEEGQEIELGDHALKIVTLPGHTPGSLLFVDQKHKLVFTGDAVGSGCGVWMQVPGGLSVREYGENLKKACLQLEALGVNDTEWQFMGGHRLQAHTSTVGAYNPICMALIADMAQLCEQIAAGTATERISTAKKFTEETVYFAVNGRAEMEYLKSRIFE